jgi:hypothetical protein
LNDLLNLPHLLMELLRTDQVGPRVVEYDVTRTKLREVISRLKEMVESCEMKISSLQSFCMRIEFFVRYERGYAFEFENLNHHPCPTVMIDTYKTTDIQDFLFDGIQSKFQIIEKLVNDDAINARLCRRSNFADNLTHDEIATYVIFSEQLLINLGISNYAGRYSQQMQKKKTLLKDRLGSFCIPEELRVPTNDATAERTFLPYTVNSNQFLARPVLTTVHSPTFTLRGKRMESHLIAEAANLGKRVYLPHLFVQAMERIHCLLVVAGGHESPTYTPLTKIDYDKIACELPRADRCKLVRDIMSELCSVYDYTWYTMVNNHRSNARTENVSRNVFPKTRNQLDTFLDFHAGSYPHVILQPRSNKYPRIDNEGMSTSACLYCELAPSEYFCWGPTNFVIVISHFWFLFFSYQLIRRSLQNVLRKRERISKKLVDVLLFDDCTLHRTNMDFHNERTQKEIR